MSDVAHRLRQLERRTERLETQDTASESSGSSSSHNPVSIASNLEDVINVSAAQVLGADGSLARGDVIIANSTPAWIRLGIGASDTFLSSDGTDVSWSALPDSFSGFANPSANVGLSAVNGAATTAMRSDAAPALDQGITPTWTGAHVFSNGLTMSGSNLDLNDNDLILDADGDTYLSTNDDYIGIFINGAADFDFEPNDFAVLPGSHITMGDDTWIGLGAAAGRLVFDTTPATDEIRVIGANLDLNANQLHLDNDGDSYLYASGDDNIVLVVPTANALFDVNLNGAVDFRFEPNIFRVQAGSDIIMGDGTSIGQAAGPTITFDDTNNHLEITGGIVGVREAPSGVEGLYVPWQSGDATYTMYVGSSTSSNDQVAIVGESYSNRGIQGNSTTGEGVRGYASGTGGTGVYALSTQANALYAETSSSSSSYAAVKGYGGSGSAIGVTGTGAGIGTEGFSSAGTGVKAHSATGTALVANLTGAGTAIFQAQDNGSVAFEVDDGGNVGIGLSGAAMRCEIEDTGVNGDPESSGTTQTHGLLRLDGAGATVLDVGINATAGEVWFQGTSDADLSATRKLIFNTNGGDILMPGVYSDTVGGTNRDLYIDNTGKLGYVSSSIRHKMQISEMALSQAKALLHAQPARYQRKEHPGIWEYGFIAEWEVDRLPEYVSVGDSGPATVEKTRMIPALVKLLQDHETRLERLENDTRTGSHAPR